MQGAVREAALHLQTVDAASQLGKESVQAVLNQYRTLCAGLEDNLEDMDANVDALQYEVGCLGSSRLHLSAGSWHRTCLRRGFCFVSGAGQGGQYSAAGLDLEAS